MKIALTDGNLNCNFDFNFRDYGKLYNDQSIKIFILGKNGEINTRFLQYRDVGSDIEIFLNNLEDLKNNSLNVGKNKTDTTQYDKSSTVMGNPSIEQVNSILIKNCNIQMFDVNTAKRIVYHKKGESFGICVGYDYLIEAQRDGSIDFSENNAQSFLVGINGINNKVRELQSINRNVIFGSRNGGNIFSDPGTIGNTLNVLQSVKSMSKSGLGSTPFIGQGSTRILSKLKDLTQYFGRVVKAVVKVETPLVKEQLTVITRDVALNRMIDQINNAGSKPANNKIYGDHLSNWFKKLIRLTQGVHYMVREINAVCEFNSVRPNEPLNTSVSDKTQNIVMGFISLASSIGGIAAAIDKAKRTNAENVQQSSKYEGVDASEILAFTSINPLLTKINGYLSSPGSTYMSLNNFAEVWDGIYAALLGVFSVLGIEEITIDNSTPLNIKEKLVKIENRMKLRKEM